MTDAKRLKAIKEIIAEHTAAHTGSKQIARKTLIKEGIYSKSGKLRVEYGGRSSKKKVNAA